VSCGLKLNGELKRIAQDFRVTELHEIIADSCKNTIPIKAVATGLKVKDEKSDIFEGLEGDSLIKEIVGAANLKLIFDTNYECQRTLELMVKSDTARLGKSSEIDSIYLLLPRGTSKLHRGLLHRSIKESYPFLMTSILTAEECLQIDNKDNDNNDNDNNEVTIEDYEGTHDNTIVTEDILDGKESLSPNDLSAANTGIKVSPDWSLVELCQTSLSMVDITAIYAYKNCGSHHKDAGNGVKIGVGLTRDQRTLVYKIITSKYLSLGIYFLVFFSAFLLSPICLEFMFFRLVRIWE
jgi:hypothetical protein